MNGDCSIYPRMKRKFKHIGLCALLALAACFVFLSKNGRATQTTKSQFLVVPNGSISVPQNDYLTIVAEVPKPSANGSGATTSEKTGLEDVVAHFERSGIKGIVRPMPPINPDIMDMITITLDTGGHGDKMVIVVRCNDEAGATRSFQDAKKNPV